VLKREVGVVGDDEVAIGDFNVFAHITLVFAQAEDAALAVADGHDGRADDELVLIIPVCADTVTERAVVPIEQQAVELLLDMRATPIEGGLEDRRDILRLMHVRRGASLCLPTMPLAPVSPQSISIPSTFTLCEARSSQIPHSHLLHSHR
jgi:hypothetical protein